MTGAGTRDAPEVEVAEGVLRGRGYGPVASWLGVPYAAPPVGAHRFAAPAPPEPWSGARLAVAPGPAAVQPRTITAPASAIGPVSEDCLYLNVAAPTAPGPPRPVLVWIHGGSFATGCGALYDGRHLAVEGDLVVITINYRLGVLGFADLGPVVDEPLPSNLGLRDQIAALQWIRANVAAFGGDPDKITVAGQSAGSVSVALLSCANTGGLFRSMICQSGSYSLVHGPQVRAEVAERYARRLGLGPGGLERLRSLPADQLLDAQADVGRQVRNTTAAAPWFDGELLPVDLPAARAITRPDLALLAGATHDEVTMFQRLPGDVMPTTRADLAARLRSGLGDEAAARILDFHPDTAVGTRDLGTEFNFAGPTRHFADRHSAAGGRTYLYRFDAAVPVLGATHAAELPYQWGWRGWSAVALRGPLTPARRRLGERLRRHWTAFVRHQDPGPDWPAYTAPVRATRVFAAGGDSTAADPAAGLEAAWAGADLTSRE